MEPADSAQIAFYVERARASGGTALELGCGTGVIAVALALAGVPVWAFDSSRQLVGLAAERANALRLRPGSLRLEQADPRELRLERRFSFVYVPSSALLLLPGPDDVLAVLATAREHLSPAGGFAFDVRQPPQRYDDPFPRSAAEWRLILARRPHLRARANGGRPGSVHRLQLLDPSVDELDRALETTGLAVLERWGGFAEEPFGPESGRMVVVAELA